MANPPGLNVSCYSSWVLLPLTVFISTRGRLDMKQAVAIESAAAALKRFSGALRKFGHLLCSFPFPSHNYSSPTVSRLNIMHLIDCKTLTLKWFSTKPPPYAILSHTWGADETTFAEFGSPTRNERSTGFRKIKASCDQAQQHSLDFVWVGTCCINKESSAELGEAINSMFKWYQDAAICYVYTLAG
ncbi:heterokaryon incompatibility protein-domain-containing protein [Podospora aff. communis PSN243]|uniref:Heterokaryon incompatibility protein-domain-containing protein n=1 Tax=Podospora aff. communis PSN243 TaxID=3040156 RepID=A0AAV9GDZ6_9PEZI|nr:heterokaryon incompatibility protein-domain-containing protein [Podospora aff. communis PSN243]